MGFDGKKIGKYALKDKLGQGGMGVVFLAVQEGLEREVALKVLPEKNLERSKDLLRRFMKEASVCAKLSHPNIIKVYDYGFEQGLYYYAMEVLRATSLEDVLKKQPVQPVDFTLRIAREMAGAFEYYHPMNIVHRDIKPANIMLDGEGKSILTDFGLVKDLLSTGITREGAAVGTPYYMAPEQVTGQPVDGATDIWQLGVVLYRMLTGRLPFKGEGGMDVLRVILTEPPALLTSLNPKVPPSLENLVMNCLEKDRGVRYRSAQELAADLTTVSRRGFVARRRELADGGAAPALPSPQPLRSTRSLAAARSPSLQAAPQPPRSSSWIAPSMRIAAIVLLIPAAFALVWWRGRHADFAAMEVLVRAGSRRAIVDWQSPSEYAGQIEWTSASGDAALRVSSVDSPGRLKHSIVLEPLEVGREYRFCILFPDGRRSLEYNFRAPDAPLSVDDLRVDATSLELTFSTAAPAVALLRSGEHSARDAEPASNHRLKLEGIDPVSAPLELSFTDAAGDAVHLEREELLTYFRRQLLPRRLPAWTAALESWSPDSFLLRQIDRKLPPAVCSGAIATIQAVGIDGIFKGQSAGPRPSYSHFTPGDPAALPLATEIRSHLESRPFAPILRELLVLGRGVFDDRRIPADSTARLLQHVEKFRSLDYFAAFLAIPYSSGVDSMFVNDCRPALQPAISNPLGALEETLPEGTAFAHPYKEYLLGERTGLDKRSMKLLGSFDWNPVLGSPQRWSRSELSLLDLRLEPELLFRVTINRQLVLTFRNDPLAIVQDRAGQMPTLSVTFDPRFLKPGENHIHLEISETPGTRYLGLRTANGLRALRLTWQ
ncbi:MAG: serine/threonine protein kinase [Candidatus Wallbacteria bacterium]|nr:serine/threonine protein kinase [Candidatus Wallbacteria bacterium]